MSSKFSKLFSWLHRSRAEEGQAMVMVAFSLVVLLGFGAFAIDLGHIAVVKSDLQNAADAAALAGVVDSDKVNTAVKYAKDNGMDVNAPFAWNNGDRVDPTPIGTKQLKVQCSREVDYYFAGVLGFESKVVTAVAVAEINNAWDGEVLPFLNDDQNPLKLNTQFEVWEKVDSGYFESIDNFTIVNEDSPTTLYFNVDIDQGLLIKNGKVASKEKAIQAYYNTHKSGSSTPYVYIFSLSNWAIAHNSVNLMNQTDPVTINDYKNKDSYIALSSLVLVKCKWDSYNKKKIKLTPIAIYDLGNDDPNNPLIDYPPDYVNPDGTGAKLIL